jgi:hypothetical protein
MSDSVKEPTRQEVHTLRDAFIDEVKAMKESQSYLHWTLDQMKSFLKSFDSISWDCSVVLISMMDLKEDVSEMVSRYDQSNPKSMVPWHKNNNMFMSTSHTMPDYAY